jgi:hypothetical protein
MNSKTITAAAILFALGSLLAGLALAAEAPRMGKDELEARLGQSTLVVIDVRAPSDWAATADKVRGALRENPDDFGGWSEKYLPEKTLVLYCA